MLQTCLQRWEGRDSVPGFCIPTGNGQGIPWVTLSIPGTFIILQNSPSNYSVGSLYRTTGIKVGPDAGPEFCDSPGRQESDSPFRQQLEFRQLPDPPSF